MDVREDAGLRPADYKLKLNSYDLGVDIELADALQRLRFEHPEVHAVVLTSLKPRIFCAGANIFMLGIVEPRLQGELLQVHQRDAARHGGHERQQRHQVPRRGQRHLRRRRLRAGAGLRRDRAGRRRQRVGGAAGDAAARRAARHGRADARGRQAQGASRSRRRLQHADRGRARQARRGRALRRRRLSDQQVPGSGGEAGAGAGREIRSARRPDRASRWVR